MRVTKRKESSGKKNLRQRQSVAVQPATENVVVGKSAEADCKADSHLEKKVKKKAIKNRFSAFPHFVSMICPFLPSSSTSSLECVK